MRDYRLRFCLAGKLARCFLPPEDFSGIGDRALNLEFQLPWALKVSSSHSPGFVGWGFEGDRAPFNYGLEVAIAIFTFKSYSCRNVVIARIENKSHGVE